MTAILAAISRGAEDDDRQHSSPRASGEGTTESGIRCHAFITRIAVHQELDSSQFERELQEVKPLSRELTGVYDARLVL